MGKTISVCGSDCSKCYCFESKMCAGCNECGGKVFHCCGGECAIYHCCVTEHVFLHCMECEKIPCDIWKTTRDPKFNDEEFAANIAERIRTLRTEQIYAKSDRTLRT